MLKSGTEASTDKSCPPFLVHVPMIHKEISEVI